jgi:signal transduction histidine kinase
LRAIAQNATGSRVEPAAGVSDEQQVSNGMGMGLAICRSIIEAHDGRLWASAGAQGASVFQFILPANVAS